MKIFNTFATTLAVATLSLSLTSCNEPKSTPEKSVSTEAPVKAEVKPVEKKDAVWHTDFEAAKNLAKKENKPIFIDFSGSDWCHWCVKLDEEVFHKPEFIKYANENLVLFMADFPRAKEQSAEIKKQNQALMQKYGVRGFPTIIILDSNAEKIGKMSYQPGGPVKYVESIKAALSK